MAQGASGSVHPRRRVVYLAHGGSKYTKQAIYSIHTLLHWMTLEGGRGVEIVVCTDDVSWVPQHDAIVTRTLDADTLARHKGRHGYVHRIKLAVLAAVQQEADGAILFVDCDTKWIRSPLAAFEALERDPRLCFMHEDEGRISEDNHPSYWHALTRGCAFQARFGVAPSWTMWNSGVIGVPPGSGGFFADAAEVTDAILDEGVERYWVEQLAVSLLATTRFNVQAFDDHLLHFWRDSYALPEVIDTILPTLTGEVRTDAQLCADFPLEDALGQYRRSARGWIRRRSARIRRSISKRTMVFSGLIRPSLSSSTGR